MQENKLTSKTLIDNIIFDNNNQQTLTIHSKDLNQKLQKLMEYSRLDEIDELVHAIVGEGDSVSKSKIKEFIDVNIKFRPFSDTDKRNFYYF